MAVLQP